MLFSQSKFLPVHGYELESGILEILSRAKRSIVICSCEFNSRSDFLLSGKLYEKLNQGCKIRVFGNNYRQLHSLWSSFNSPNLDVNVWNPPAEKSLFHIKAVVVDDTYIYIGSANLSINAMTNSSEWGLTGNSPDIALSLVNYLKELEDSNLFLKLV